MAQCLVVVDDERTRSLDMVPTGSRCGDNKVCSNQRCVDTSSVYGPQEDCSAKCNNKGVCNHKKQCHCEPGWAPPYCDMQYADLRQDWSMVIVAVCAVLGVLLALVGVAVGVVCCKKDRKENYPSKRKVHYTPGKLNPMFQEKVSNGKLQISQPTFMETTATHACTPLFVTVVPTRPAPQAPPKSTESDASQSEPLKTSPPLCRSLPPLNSKQCTPAKVIPPPGMTSVKSSLSPVHPVKSSPSLSTANPSSQAQSLSGAVQSTTNPSSQAQSFSGEVQSTARSPSPCQSFSGEVQPTTNPSGKAQSIPVNSATPAGPQTAGLRSATGHEVSQTVAAVFYRLRHPAQE
ncbi:hypothetical protein CRUP_033293 [Coryphaenoides rupestris]|nr:hypothetical protein CRUP_033293 [Coryphaenoides rupestris]